MQEHIIRSIDELPQLAKSLLDFAEERSIFVFKGSLGAGKTTFIKYLSQAIGSNDEVTSPTYSIVNEYVSSNYSIFHFDLYRMKDYEEILDIGFWEYFEENTYIFIEWADLVVAELDKYTFVSIETQADGSRKFCFENC